MWSTAASEPSKKQASSSAASRTTLTAPFDSRSIAPSLSTMASVSASASRGSGGVA